MADKIRWSPRASDDLEAICNYIARDSERYAAIFVQNVFQIINHIPHFPLSGRIVPEYNNENLREKIFGNYRIVYRLKNEIIEIVAIHHGARIFTI
ncbi:MAG: type II toxin-antitoxin system RelE/ParE family toxin [Bacteroidota bacterium]|nr:type II toxin-antitoxin system RelE/ParE family toxin [Bacteroidota bacterium]